jgi:hypothetical protein
MITLGGDEVEVGKVVASNWDWWYKVALYML